jgi:hypothetical protein
MTYYSSLRVLLFYFVILKISRFFVPKNYRNESNLHYKNTFFQKKVQLFVAKKKTNFVEKKSLLTSYLLCHIEPAPLNRTPSTACPMPITTPFVDEPQLS